MFEASSGKTGNCVTEAQNNHTLNALKTIAYDVYY